MASSTKIRHEGDRYHCDKCSTGFLLDQLEDWFTELYVTSEGQDVNSWIKRHHTAPNTELTFYINHSCDACAVIDGGDSAADSGFIRNVHVIAKCDHQCTRIDEITVLPRSYYICTECDSTFTTGHFVSMSKQNAVVKCPLGCDTILQKIDNSTDLQRNSSDARSPKDKLTEMISRLLVDAKDSLSVLVGRDLVSKNFQESHFKTIMIPLIKHLPDVIKVESEVPVYLTFRYCYPDLLCTMKDGYVLCIELKSLAIGFLNQYMDGCRGNDFGVADYIDSVLKSLRSSTYDDAKNMVHYQKGRSNGPENMSVSDVIKSAVSQAHDYAERLARDRRCDCYYCAIVNVGVVPFASEIYKIDDANR